VTVRVLFFAHLRERCGRETALEVPDDASVADAIERLRERFPAVADSSVRVALNRVYVDTAHLLHDNDELAFIPAVSGG